MSSAIGALREEFERVSQDLDATSAKVAEEMAASHGDVSPMEVLARIDNMQTQLESVRDRWAAVLAAKQSVMDAASQCLLPSRSAIKSIQRATGTEPVPDESDQTLKEFGEVSRQWDRSLAALSQPERRRAAAVPQPVLTSEELNNRIMATMMDGERDQRSAAVAGAPAKVASQPPPAAAAPPSRMRSDRFIPVTVEEFESVSALARGRTTLESANAIYAALYEHFITARPGTEPEPLSVKEMVGMGLDVSGSSGQARLNTLRTLKLLHITTKGVTLQPGAHKPRPAPSHSALRIR